MDNPFEKTPEELKQNRVTCPNCDEVEFIHVSIIGSVRCSRCGCLLSPPPVINFGDVTKRRFKVFEERAEQPDHEVTYRGYEPTKDELEQEIKAQLSLFTGDKSCSTK
jgi:hypothetical protein